MQLWQVGSALVVVFGAGIFIALERCFPYEPKQKTLREGLVNDLLFYGIAQSYVLGLIIAWIIRALQGCLGSHRLVSTWPIWLQTVFFLVAHDVYIYWFHRAQHHSRYLWRIHEAHHSGTSVDWISGARSHSLEILINQTIEFAPMALLGASPETAIIKVTIDSLWGMYIHSNINVRSGFLQRFLNGPEMHRWHHAKELKAPGFNFATKLAVWDWLFGTALLPRAKPSSYGISLAAFPTGYIAQHLFAFRSFSRARRVSTL